MLEADAVLAQEVVPSGTLRSWLALASHVQAA
jgi:hypothetical protein